MSECKPVMEAAWCPVPGCHYDDEHGKRAWEGRARLLDDLRTPGPETDCHCRKCQMRAAPPTDDEAAAVMRHVTDRQAVLYLLGKVYLGGLTSCEDCEEWVPVLNPTPTEPDLDLQRGCPFHPL